jgi:hypothetical protein
MSSMVRYRRDFQNFSFQVRIAVLSHFHPHSLQVTVIEYHVSNDRLQGLWLSVISMDRTFNYVSNIVACDLSGQFRDISIASYQIEKLHHIISNRLFFSKNIPAQRSARIASDPPMSLKSFYRCAIAETWPERLRNDWTRQCVTIWWAWWHLPRKTTSARYWYCHEPLRNILRRRLSRGILQGRKALSRMRWESSRLYSARWSMVSWFLKPIGPSPNVRVLVSSKRTFTNRFPIKEGGTNWLIPGWRGKHRFVVSWICILPQQLWQALKE